VDRRGGSTNRSSATVTGEGKTSRLTHDAFHV
jgi:hypothetical protein